jgi:hypothetical protein
MNVRDIKQIYEVVNELFHKKVMTWLDDPATYIAEYLVMNNCFNNLEQCLSLLDSINYDYNSKGLYFTTTEFPYDYIVQWACGHRRLDLIKELVKRNVSFINHNLGQSCIELYCIGLNNSHEDFFEGLRFLFEFGLKPNCDLIKVILKNGNVHKNVSLVIKYYKSK